MRTLLFKEMLDLSKHCRWSAGSVPFQNYVNSTVGVKGLKENVSTLISESRPFVISDSILNKLWKIKKDNIINKAERFELDIPFSSIFIEGEECAIVANQRFDGLEANQTYGVFVQEAGSEGYLFVAWTKEPNNILPIIHTDMFSRSQWEAHQNSLISGRLTASVGACLHGTISELFNFFRNQDVSVGTVKVSERVRVGAGEARTLFKIKEVVHICLTKDKEKAESEFQRSIDWSHRWEVMGHWRKCTAVGKNRSGEYVIKGLTWVNPYVKGPEEKVFVKKLRVTDMKEQIA